MARLISFSRALALLASATSSVSAEYNGFEPPEVSVYVSQALSSLSPYLHYHGQDGHLQPAAATSTLAPQPTATSASCAYWMDEIKHSGVAAFNNDTSYVVYRNVKDYGAVGDGVTDDTAAINNAISSGNRYSPSAGITGTNAAAVVYFPPGTYAISTPIIDYYFTQVIGNPNCLPVIRASSNFSGSWLFDGDEYGANGLDFGATNVFYRQLRNFIFDTTLVPYNAPIFAIHWPTAQATSLQNVVVKMPDVAHTEHIGILVESGSGGFMTDLVFEGGKIGMDLGNQQFTMRNLSISNSVTAIFMIWDWGWTFSGLQIDNCTTAVDLANTVNGTGALQNAAVIVYDSSISNSAVAFNTSYSGINNPPAGGALILENVVLSNVKKAVTGRNGTTTLLAGPGAKTTTIAGYAQGHEYLPTGPQAKHGAISPNTRPSVLLGANGNYYTQSKPQYSTLSNTSVVTARSFGAKGNGIADDSAALQKAISSAASQGKLLFVDAGIYRVTKTILIPAGSQIVGETYPVIMSSGAFFQDMSNPKPVVRVGLPGAKGVVQWSDMVVGTQGPQAGATLIEWNIASPAGTPSGMWDVHTRIGGFIGSKLQGNVCPTTPNVVATPSNIKKQCFGAYMSMHVTTSASGLYMENNWLWTADHDIDANYGGNQITVYTGRGLYVESTAGTLWLYGTAVEHHSKYQYQFANTKNIIMGQVQTETPYYQPNPNATIPFVTVSAINDPVFPTAPYPLNKAIPNANAFGMRVLSSSPILIYGAGFYSFFNNYSTVCSQEVVEEQGVSGNVCQSRIFQKDSASEVYLYDLHTIGTRAMINVGGKDIAFEADNVAGFSEEIILFRDS